MYEGIDNLKSLYDVREDFLRRSFCGTGLSRRTARPDPVRQPSIGSGAPKNPRTGIAAPPDEVTRPTSVHVAVVQQLLN
uniref:Uncharacterized protein n=1 Tax=Peronospora matthiolae TaxID=2874970 RepID=A0AAV1T843_9STRA